MKKNILLLVCIFISLGTFIAVADSSGEGDYDEDEFGPLAPVIWTKPVKTVIFNHKTHTMGAELDCESCHDEIFEMEAGVAEEDEDFTMEAMYEGNSCGTCHDGDIAFSAATRCTTCHIGVRGEARLRRNESGKEGKGGH